MKKMTCEICKNSNLIKENGVFVCQTCGIQYTIDEAKKLISDGTDGVVEVTGTVKIDSSSELINLYEVARRAKDTNNSENALKYYDMILVKDPNSWEANFYVIYFRAFSCKIGEIQIAATNVSSSIYSTLELVKNSSTDCEEKQTEEDIILEIFTRLLSISEMLYNSANSFYDGIDYQIKVDFTQEYINNVFSATNILYGFGDILLMLFGEKYGEIASEAWKSAVNMHNGFINILADKESNKNLIVEYSEKIKKYDSNYQTPHVNTSGCYIATATYGSYDCREVWVLRRYRDNVLDKTFYGREFIKLYYSISPIILKWFGNINLFKSISRNLLDKLVKRLFAKGIKDTPYRDKN